MNTRIFKEDGLYFEYSKSCKIIEDYIKDSQRVVTVDSIKRNAGIQILIFNNDEGYSLLEHSNHLSDSCDGDYQVKDCLILGDNDYNNFEILEQIWQTDKNKFYKIFSKLDNGQVTISVGLHSPLDQSKEFITLFKQIINTIKYKENP